MTRTRGEGTTYQRKDGRWVSEVTIGWRPDGRGGLKRKRRRVLAATEKEAANKRLDLIGQRRAGLPLPDGRLTVDAWMTHWLETICPRRVRASTLRTYQSYYRLWIAPAIGTIKLRELRAEHLDALYDFMASKGLAAASQLQAHRIVTRALQVALQREHVARNVGRLVDPPTGPAKEAQWLNGEQVHVLLSHAINDRHYVRWIVAIALGLRQGEALGLCWPDVDLKAGTVHVRQQLVRVPGASVTIGPLKTKASDRILPLPPTLLRLLRKHRRADLEQRLVGDGYERWSAHELVFRQPCGRPIDHARDYRNWVALLKRSGLPVMPLHSARHTTATLLLLQGVPLAVAAGFMGHASTRMTERYTHSIPSLVRAASIEVEHAMWG